MSQHLGWDMKLSICLYKNNRGMQNWVGWGYYYYTTTLGRAANLLKLKFTCGFLHVQWFIHTKRERLVSRGEGDKFLTESATSETLTSVWDYFRVSTRKGFFRLWYGWQFVDGMVCGGFQFVVRSIRVHVLPIKARFGASFQWRSR